MGAAQDKVGPCRTGAAANAADGAGKADVTGFPVPVFGSDDGAPKIDSGAFGKAVGLDFPAGRIWGPGPHRCPRAAGCGGKASRRGAGGS